MTSILWSSSVELPILCLCLTLCVLKKGLTLYDGDACDAYVHCPAPKTMTHLMIDNTYFRWYKEKTVSI